MKNFYISLLILSLCILPVCSDTVKTNTCLMNLYETKSEVISVPTNVVVTKPKRKLFSKQKTEMECVPEVIIPVEKNGFIAFPQNYK